MSLVSFEFIAFVIVSFLLYYIFPIKYRWTVLLAASVFFYASLSGWLILYLIFSTLVIFFSGLIIQKYNDQFLLKKNGLEKSERKTLKAAFKKKKKIIVACAITINIGLLVFLKYFNFIGDTIDSIVGLFANSDLIPTISIILPIGVSYYTLMAVSYVIDVYRGVNKADKNIFRLFLFLIYFPQIIEGPIGRYNLLASQLYRGNKFNYDNVRNACLLVLWGFIKKLIIADRCAIYVNEVFDHHTSYSGLGVVVAIILYTFEIYMDFSGCIDIVTGVSGVFGVKLSENFRRPFFSKSIDEFWRRWHITLGAFFKDYIFYPASISKSFSKINKFCKKHINNHVGNILPLAYALFFVWFCNGLWHGASIKYVVYGLYYYLIMMIARFMSPLTDKVVKLLHIDREKKWYCIFQIIRTIFFVCIGMLIFRAETLGTAKEMLFSVFDDFSKASITAPIVATDMSKLSFMLVVVFIPFMFVVGYAQEKDVIIIEKIINLPIVIRWFLYILTVFSVIVFGIYGAGYDATSFIYGQF